MALNGLSYINLLMNCTIVDTVILANIASSIRLWLGSYFKVLIRFGVVFLIINWSNN